MKSFKKSQVYVVDDDAAFIVLMRHVLTKLGLFVTSFTDTQKFLEALQSSPPALCLIDLNIGEDGAGFKLIQSIRSDKKFEALPVFIISGVTDQKSVAHGLELGANDYIFKPLDRQILVSKLTNYMDTDELTEAEWASKAVIDSELSVILDLAMEVLEIDESGIRIRSPHLVMKGTSISISAPLLTEITKSDRPKLMSVSSTWIERDTGVYGAYLEFDPMDAAFVLAVRTWIAAKRCSAPL